MSKYQVTQILMSETLKRLIQTGNINVGVTDTSEITAAMGKGIGSEKKGFYKQILRNSNI